MSDKSLYETLGISPDADEATIKKAYLKLARETHPDKHPGDETAQSKFQAVGRAYAVLRDPEKRKVYDAAGIVDDGTGPPTGSGATGWYDFWRGFYDRVTTDRLDQLAAEYRGSAEEAADLKAAYKAAKGDVGKIIDSMMHATVDDEPRFREQLAGWVADGTLPKTRAFEAEPEAKRRKRQDKAAKEAKEAEAHAKKLGLGDGSADSLAAAIVARNKQRDGDAFLNSLAERFGGKGEENGGGKKGKGGGGSKGKGKGKAAASMDEDPLDDAAFAAAQAKMLGKGKR